MIVRKIKSIIKRGTAKYISFWNLVKIYLLEDNVTIGRKVSIGSNVIIKTTDGGGIVIEDNVSIESNTYIYAQRGKIHIGQNTFIGTGTQIVAKQSIDIGQDVLVSAYSIIRDANHGIRKGMTMASQPHDIQKVVIEDDVWLGSHSVVTAGCKVGKGAVVGANGVVTKDVESYTVVGGVPAKFIKKRVD